MKGYSIIPDKVEQIDIINGGNIYVQTNGLNCRLKVCGEGVMLKIRTDDEYGYLLSDGEIFDFCGNLNVSCTSEKAVVYCMYYHTI